MRNVFEQTMTSLDTGSVNRLVGHCRIEFPMHTPDEDPLVDGKVMKVVQSYALNRCQIEEEEKYLSSLQVGCKRQPQMLVQALERFSKPHVSSKLWNRNVQRAIARLTRELKPKHLLKIKDLSDYELILDAIPKKDASAGFDYFITGVKHKGDYGTLAERISDEALTSAKLHGSFCMPIRTFHRLQYSGMYDEFGNRTPAKFKYKERLVSAIAFRQVIQEMRFSIPVQSYLGTRKIYVGGKKPEELTQFVNEYRHKFKFWKSIDYTGYDQAIPAFLIRAAFEIIWGWFSKDTATQSWKWLWDIVVNDFVDKAFIGPEGKLVYAQHGVPSGSMFTQIIDTLVNAIMIYSYVEMRNSKCEKGEPSLTVKCLICGDDNLVFSNKEIDALDLSRYLERMFGIECNPSKCSGGSRQDNPKFLSREWRPDGAYRHPYELYAKMTRPERFRDYKNNKDLTPEQIVYSYILAYPAGMKDLIDVNKFLRDNKMNIPKFDNSVLKYTSGYLAYLARYA